MPEQKTALIFPGQGTQWYGMGNDAYQASQHARAIYDAAWKSLGIEKGERNIPFESLNRTDKQQLAIYVTNHVFFELFRKAFPDFKYHAVAGHSLGEYNAVVASGALEFEDGLKLVEKRGRYMHEASARVETGLAALIVGEGIDIDDTLRELENEGIYAALSNSKRQIVVGGPRSSLEAATQRLIKAGIRTITLPVEGAFHTRYMNEAADQLRSDLNQTSFKLAEVPIVANSSSRYIVDPEDIKYELYLQVNKLLKWFDSVRRMLEQGIQNYLVIGADRTDIMKGLIRQVNKKVEVFTIKDMQTLDGFLP